MIDLKYLNTVRSTVIVLVHAQGSGMLCLKSADIHWSVFPAVVIQLTYYLS